MFSGKIHFQHDNAKLHVANIVKEKKSQVLTHPSYSPNLSPPDYHLFRSLSNDLKDRKFEDEDELIRYIQDFFDSKLHFCLEFVLKVIDNNGEYINT